MSHVLFVAFTAVLAASILPSQNRLVVDKLNGPGTDYTTLPAAIAASGNGDVLLVRYHATPTPPYQAASFSHGLTIVGIGGKAAIEGVLRVDNLPAGQHVFLRDLHMGPFANVPGLSNGQIQVFDCAGSVISKVSCVTPPTRPVWSRGTSSTRSSSR